MRQKGLFILAFFLIMPITVFADSLITKEAIVVEAYDGEGLTNNISTGNPVIWKARGSKFSTEGYPQFGYVNEFPQEKFGYYPENAADLNSFVVKGSFTRKGYNHIEVIPGESDGENWVETPFPLPGNIEVIDLWIWAGNYDYELDVHLVDFQGIPHVLHFGSIKHKGWKHLFVNIPTTIKQYTTYVPEFQGLSISKFVITTDPEEKVDEFYVLFDELKVIADTHIEKFDGDGVANKIKNKEIDGGLTNE